MTTEEGCIWCDAKAGEDCAHDCPTIQPDTDYSEGELSRDLFEAVKRFLAPVASYREVRETIDIVLRKYGHA